MASRIATRAFTTTARRFQQSEHVLKQESKRNPELMVRPYPRQARRHDSPVVPSCGHSRERRRSSLPRGHIC